MLSRTADDCQGRHDLRTRRYVGKHWLALLRPVLRYSYSRDAFVLRGVGRSLGPVLRANRRTRRQPPFVGIDRRHSSAHRPPRVA
jgi:hypothetical protein